MSGPGTHLASRPSPGDSHQVPTSAERRRPAWAGRNYTLLTASAVVTNLGSHGALIASAFAVLGAGGDGGDVGLVAAARTLPLVLFLLIGGAVADRLPRHRVMVAANALNCVSQAAFAALVLAGEPQLWQMMLLSGLGGAGQAFFNPAAEGMLLSSVDGEQAGRAFAVFRMAMHGATLGGAALGGAMVAAIGPGWVLAADAAAFAVAAVLRAFLDVKHIPPREPGGGCSRICGTAGGSSPAGRGCGASSCSSPSPTRSSARPTRSTVRSSRATTWAGRRPGASRWPSSAAARFRARC